MQLDLLDEPAKEASSDLVSEDSPSLFEEDSQPSEVPMDAPVLERPTTETVDAPERTKSPDAFKTITEVAELLGVQQYVLRFWESRFTQIKPVKMRGGRRYYRPDDIDVLMKIKTLLYKEGYTIKGAKKALSAKGSTAEKTEEKAAPKAKAKTGFSDKEKSQLAVIRQELMSMQDVLKPHVF